MSWTTYIYGYYIEPSAKCVNFLMLMFIQTKIDYFSEYSVLIVFIAYAYFAIESHFAYMLHCDYTFESSGEE